MFVIICFTLFVLPSKEEYKHMQCNKFWVVSIGSTSVWLGHKRSWTDVCRWTFLTHASLLCGEPAPVCFHCFALPTVSHILIKYQFCFECCRFYIQDMLHCSIGGDHWIVCVTFLHSLSANDLPSQLFCAVAFYINI